MTRQINSDANSDALHLHRPLFPLLNDNYPKLDHTGWPKTHGYLNNPKVVITSIGLTLEAHLNCR